MYGGPTEIVRMRFCLWRGLGRAHARKMLSLDPLSESIGLAR
jgi:hypothetical protein